MLLRILKTRTRFFLVLFVFSTLLMSCGAYFNTYYNADKAYQQGMKEVEAAKGKRPGQTQFNECLKISSKLLQFYPESKWVDETILMIGRCYVHLGQYHRALRKFDELDTRFTDSEWLTSSRIWRARALLELDRRESCLSELAGIPLDGLKRNDRLDALHVWADLHKRDESGHRLAGVQAELLKLSPRRRKAEWHLELGYTFLSLNQREEAVEHFKATRRRLAPRAILLEGRIAEIDSRIHLQQFEKAQDLIEGLEKDERFFDDIHQIMVQKGQLAWADKAYEKALAHWHEVLEDHTRTESAAAAACSIGRLYLRKRANTDSARVYFKRTKTESASSTWADSARIELDLLEQVETLYFDMDRLDSLQNELHTRLNPDSLTLREARSLLPALRAAFRADTLTQTDSLSTVSDSLESAPVESPAPVADSFTGGTRPVVPSVIFGEINPGRPKSAGRRNLFGFGRMEQKQAREDSLKQAALEDSLAMVAFARETAYLDSVFLIAILDTFEVQHSIDSLGIIHRIDSLASCEFDQRFGLAELQLYKLKQIEVADSLMHDLRADTAATHEQAARLIFAHGLLKEEVGQTKESLIFFEDVVRLYPMSSAANPARSRLGLEARASAQDSARVLLREAEGYWQSQQPMQAIEIYEDIKTRYPLTQEVYTAWVAQGLIYWEELGRPDLAEIRFEEAMRRFPDGKAQEQLLALLGRDPTLDDLANEASPEDELALVEAITDTSGRFVRGDDSSTIQERLDALRARFKNIGRLRLEYILDGGLDSDEETVSPLSY
jgi:cellulose synthase operon protein C